MSTTAICGPIAALLSGAGIRARVNGMSLLAEGGNNKSWRIDTEAGPYVAKQYFRHADDRRDRLAAEFAFARYASATAPDSVPSAIASDRENRIGLYSFLNGSKFLPGSIGKRDVLAAAQFFKAINPPDRHVTGRTLPTASEACFSIAGHLSLVSDRIHRLRDTLATEAEIPEARDFVDALWQRWVEIEEEVNSLSAAHNLNPSMDLPQDQRCISPSDFGFHNALRDEDGAVRFLDFEYAGWDDPAKMVGDFFAQLAVPVPGEYFDIFVAGTLGELPGARELEWRARLLRPVYQVKWCCIAMNVFLPVHLARRKFANPGLDELVLKRVQLEKARNLFQSMITRNDLH